MNAKHSQPAHDPHYHTQRLKGEMRDLVTHLREDVEHVDAPRAQALFETSAEVIEGLIKAFEHYESGSEPAWREERP